jgi:hypothetical protein
MFKWNALVVISLLAIVGCKEKRYEIIGINKMPVVIKFTIPPNYIVNTQVNSDQEYQIRSKVLKQYPGISNMQLQLHSNISGIEYYDYTGELVDEKVNVFVFDSRGDLAIRVFKSEIPPDIETRYQLDRDGLRIYKRLPTGKPANIAVKVFYQFKDESISFYHDDGFSIW